MLRSLVGSEMCIRDSVVFTPSVWEMNFVDMTAYDHSRDVSEGVLALHALFPRAKIVVINQHYHHTPVLHPGQQRARFPGAVCRTPSVVARYRDGVLCGISNHSMAAYQRESKVAMRKGSFCLLYTSDAADEEDSVDLGGRRIIKKKNRNGEMARAE
eukprot:TRINITY_DN37945_c0_g1_i2.p1 TRINITY_DN37945_c0_g1~~TRINITY_DN37945_c0_g1_i2.p1  ORF type:complete len:157 (-),score=29.32 TRINITY_DN37945_c0_g1_i2:86-556(-)